MKSFIFLIWMLLFFRSSHAQQITFARSIDTLGCYYANCVRQTFDGGYILCGSSYGSSAQDAAIIKTDSLGDILWVKLYGGPSTDGALLVEQTPDSGYIVAGIKDAVSANDTKIWLLKLNGAGDTLWTKSIVLGLGNNFPTELIQTYDGGYAMTGYTSGRGNGSYDAFLIKTNVSGDTLWAKTYGQVTPDVGYSLKQTVDSGYIIAGETVDSSGIYADVYLIRTDSHGDTTWTKAIGTSNTDGAQSVQQTTDGGFIVAGLTWNTISYNYNCYLLKISPIGDTVWTKAISDNRSAGAYVVQQTSDGGYIIGGTIAIGTAPLPDYLLMKTNSFGDTIWTKQYGGASTDICYSMQQTSDGGYVMTGESHSFSPNSIYLVKTDSLGFLAVGVSEIPSGNDDILVFPNPGTKFTIVVNTIPIKDYELEVTNVLGKLVYSKYDRQDLSNMTIDLSHVPNSIYFLSIKTGKKVIVKKIVVSH